MIHVSDRLQVLLSNLAAQVMRVAASLFLLRLIPPIDHGTVAIVAAATGMFASFGDFGLRRFLVQNREWPEEQLRDTLFVMLVGIGLLLFAIFLACGWYLAVTNVRHGWIFEVPERDYRLFWIAAALGATSVFSAVYDTQLGLMSRRLAFAQEARQQLIFALAQAGSGIIYAFAGLGVFALALQPLTAQLVANVTVLRYQPLFLPRQFRLEIARACIKPGLQMGLAYYFAAVAAPLQQWLYFTQVARNREMLAFFQKIVQLREMVTFNFVFSAFDRLIFPLFSQNQHDPTRLRDLYLRGSAMVAIFVSLCGWGLVTTSPELVRVAAGPQWDTLNDPKLLRALCLPLLITTGPGAVGLFLCSAINRPYVWSIHSVVILVLSFLTAFVAGGAGAVGLIIGFSVAQIIASIYVITWAVKVLNLSPATLMMRLSRPFLIGAISGVATLLAKPYLLAGGLPWYRLVATGALFTTLFIVLAWTLDRETFLELRRLVHRKPKLEPQPEEA